MIDEVKVEKLEELVDAIVASVDSGLPEITESDEGKALIVDNGEPAWGEIESGDSLVYDNTVSTKIGEYHEHDGQTITVHVIKSLVCSPLNTIYLGNGQGSFEANIGNNAEILSCQLVAWDGYTIYSIPCSVNHNTGTLPANNTYEARWNSASLPSDGGSAKFYVTYVEQTA